jgi:geranylgeranyl diphosphate synthase, type I
MMTEIQSTIQEAMRSAFPNAERSFADFYAMQEYHLGWLDSNLRPVASTPGKLLRPQLVLLACRAVGGDVARALPLAASIQLIHDFTLIHDDIEDYSETRRGRTTVWKQWGLAHGVNAGDGMFALAHLALHQLSDAGAPAAIVLELLKCFDQAILLICEGQYLDLSFEGKLLIGETDYLKMIGRKTAALFSAASGMGGMVGGADPENVLALFAFGHNLGLAFQIQDDILGIWGSARVTGKISAADLYRRKVSLPIIHALRHSHNRAELAAIYRQDQLSESDILRALAILDAAGSRDHAEALAISYHATAVRALEAISTSGSAAEEAALAQLHGIADRALSNIL